MKIEAIDERKLSVTLATSRITAAWLAANPLRYAAMSDVIVSVYQTLAALPVPGMHPPAPVPVGPPPAVNPRRSLFHDRVLCIECGLPFVTMRRHLMRSHGLKPAAYRTKWNLPASYPIVAPDYAKIRSAMAKELGLGHHPSIKARRSV